MTTIDILSNPDAQRELSARRLAHQLATHTDLPALCEAVHQRLAQHDSKRARLAAVVLRGAANDTSRRLAMRLVAGWFSEEVAAAVAERGLTK